MQALEIAGTVLGLITAAGGGSVATYFWQKFTRRLDEATIESRLELIKKFKDSKISTNDDRANSQNKLESAYFYAIYMDSINQLVRQIHKASGTLWTKIKITFFIGSAAVLAIFFTVLALLLQLTAAPTWNSTLMYAGAFLAVIFCTWNAAALKARHEVSTSALSNCLLGAQTDEQIIAVIHRALEGEQFFKEEGRFFTTYQPLTLQEISDVPSPNTTIKS